MFAPKEYSDGNTYQAAKESNKISQISAYERQLSMFNTIYSPAASTDLISFRMNLQLMNLIHCNILLRMLYIRKQVIMLYITSFFNAILTDLGFLY